MGRKKENIIISGLEITSPAAEGKAMGHADGQVVFVPMAVPGDVVDVEVKRKRRRFMEGRILRFVSMSPQRVEPFCDHFGVCGGCSWQNLPYAEQLKFKRQQVEDQLVRIGHLNLPAEGVLPTLGSAQTEFYRNKLEFTFAPHKWLTAEELANVRASDDCDFLAKPSPGRSERASFAEVNFAKAISSPRPQDGSGFDLESSQSSEAKKSAEPALGFHIPGLFDKILDIERCHLQPEPSNAIRLSIKQFCVESEYEFYDIRRHTGLMRGVVIRTASTGEVMVIVVFAAPDEDKIAALLDHLRAEFPDITSLMYIVNEKLNDSLGDQEAILHSGRDHIFEQMEDLRFKIGPKSFYQTNSAQAHELYKVARDFAGLTLCRNADCGSGNALPVVYDLYTGTGTIANFVARGAAKVVGIEYVTEAIEDARENSRLNGISNTVFFAGDMRRVLTEQFVKENGHPNVVILDPPRAGVDAPVVDVILNAAPEIIVYVSCNPATQARDLALMAGAYEIGKVQPVDMFPHTHHVENVVKLVRRQ